VIKGKFFVIFFCWISAIAPLWSQGDFYVDQQIRDNYILITELKLDKAAAQLRAIKQKEPGHLMVLLLENYIDFYKVFIHEDLEEFKRLEQNKEIRLEKVRKGNPKSPYYRVVQAEILLQWAISRLKFEEYYTALLETRKAHGLLLENKEKYPDFLPSHKGLAMIHGVVGTIPDSYRYLLKLFTGLEGSIQEGMQEIEALKKYAVRTGDVFEPEIHAIQALICLHLVNEPEKAWQIIQAAGLDYRHSALAAFMIANVARHTGRTDEAIRILEERIPQPGEMEFLYLDFMLGTNKLHRLDSDADQYLLKFAQKFGGRHYIKEAYQKLAWHAWVIKKDEKLAKAYYRQCLKKGSRLMEEDDSAHEDALILDLPYPAFLKSRLLFDGGYYRRSLDMLHSEQKILMALDRLQFYYQKGRNLQMLNEHQEAIQSFEKVISMKDRPNAYQKCNATLQCGIICEKTGQRQKAVEYYRMVLEMSPDKYEKSLQQKAKAGLNRLAQ